MSPRAEATPVLWTGRDANDCGTIDRRKKPGEDTWRRSGKHMRREFKARAAVEAIEGVRTLSTEPRPSWRGFWNQEDLDSSATLRAAIPSPLFRAGHPGRSS